MTESSKHGSEKQAGWVIKQKMGKIVKPENGDFDIVKKYGGNWLVTGADISYDGKYWISKCTYLYSPDGWDEELYDKG